MARRYQGIFIIRVVGVEVVGDVGVGLRPYVDDLGRFVGGCSTVNFGDVHLWYRGFEDLSKVRPVNYRTVVEFWHFSLVRNRQRGQWHRRNRLGGYSNSLKYSGNATRSTISVVGVTDTLQSIPVTGAMSPSWA